MLLNTNLFQGDLYNHESLVKAIRAVDVVVSAVGYAQLPDQVNIIAAIKEAGNVKVWITGLSSFSHFLNFALVKSGLCFLSQGISNITLIAEISTIGVWK